MSDLSKIQNMWEKNKTQEEVDEFQKICVLLKGGAENAEMALSLLHANEMWTAVSTFFVEHTHGIQLNEELQCVPQDILAKSLFISYGNSL